MTTLPSIRTHRTVCPLGAVLLAMALCPVAAFSACGGGGSSSGYTPVQPTPTPSWTPDQTASSQAVESGTGILYAIESAQQPIGIWDDRLQHLSKTTPFVIIQPSDADAFIARTGLDVHAPALAVTDAYGNVIWAANASTSVNQVIAALHAAPEAQQETCTRSTRQVAAAQADLDHGHVAQALKRLTAVLALQGYPAVAQAKALYAQIIRQGESQVSSCLAISSHDPATAKSRLRMLSEQYVHTPVDQQIDHAIKSLQ
jgi:hypothetical protein